MYGLLGGEVGGGVGCTMVMLRGGCSVTPSHNPVGVNWTSTVCEPTDKFGNTSPDEPVTSLVKYVISCI